MRFKDLLTDLIMTLIVAAVISTAAITYGSIILAYAGVWLVCASIVGRLYVVRTFKEQLFKRHLGEKTSYMARWFRWAVVIVAPFALSIMVLFLIGRFILTGSFKAKQQYPPLKLVATAA